MNAKILIATHKEYKMPKDNCYLPIHVGKEGKENIGYIGDNTGENISNKNPYYCELTALYWGASNLDCDYLGLVHYRRHFTKKGYFSRLFRNKYDLILSESELEELLINYDVIVPKKRKYYIESLYSHYAHTHYADHLDKTRKIIETHYPDYVKYFDIVMKQTEGHMFNMFIMKKSLVNEYCSWLFKILEELEEEIDITQYDSFQARLYGRVSELLFNVWLVKNNIKYTELNHLHMDKINWFKKGSSFLNAKLRGRKFEKSF